MYYSTIVALGDSLTAGYGVAENEAWPALLKQRLLQEGRPGKVLNHGISGETSGEALARLDAVLAEEPQLVIVAIGVNDLLVYGNCSDTRANIAAILTRLQQAGCAVLLAGMRMVWLPEAEGVEEFNSLYPELAEQFDVDFMPFLLQDVALEPQLTLPDLVHPDARGYQRITDNIFPYVTQALDSYLHR